MPNTREKRQSALSVLQPTRAPGIVPDAPGIDVDERKIAGWSYAGILADNPIVPEALIVLTGDGLFAGTMTGETLGHAQMANEGLVGR